MSLRRSGILALPLSLALLAACGSAEPAPLGASPEGGSASPDAGGTRAKPDTGAAAAGGRVGGTAPGLVRIGLTNDTAETITTFNDSQTFPYWLHIGDPAMPLTAYGSKFCGIEPATHNDPAFHRVAIAPGERIEYVWRPIVIERSAAQDCWQQRFVTPGDYVSRACVFQGVAPANFFPGEDAGVPESCTSFSLSVPTSGESGVEVSVR